MTRTIEEAKKSLQIVLPYFRKAVADANKNGVVKLGILCEHPDGTGNVEMRFDCAEFFADLALVLDVPPQSADDDMNATALQFLQSHGLTTG